MPRAYRDYMQLMGRFADALKPFWHKTMPRIGATGLKSTVMTFAQLGLKLRGLGKKGHAGVYAGRYFADARPHG